MTLVAGVDSSTQSCKVVIVDLETGSTVRAGRAPHPPGTAVNPAAWWSALSEAIVDAGGIDDCAAISIAGQQHGMVALDAAGVVVHDALLWNDTRSAQAAAELIDELGAPVWAERTGLVPVASFTATKLRWLRDHHPELAARVAAVALPHDWLTWRLRGYGPTDPLGPQLGELVTDRSDASGTAYWSPVTGEYDRDLLVRALGHDVILPRVLGPHESAGVVYGTNIVVGPGAGDNAGAALGLGAGIGDVVVSIGTSGTVFAVTNEPVSDATGLAAGFADAAGAYLPLVATLNAARVLDTVAGLLGVDHSGLGELALRAEPGAGGVVLRPYFEGERTPNLPDASASLLGLRMANTSRENLARAAIEGVLCGLADGLDALLRLGVHAQRVLVIGGGARNAAVAPIAASVFGVPIDLPEPDEYVARGGAVQAAWVLTGARPSWPVPNSATSRATVIATVREQYRDARAY